MQEKQRRIGASEAALRSLVVLYLSQRARERERARDAEKGRGRDVNKEGE